MIIKCLIATLFGSTVGMIIALTSKFSGLCWENIGAVLLITGLASVWVIIMLLD